MVGDVVPRSDAIAADRRVRLPRAVLRFASDETLVGQLRAGSDAAFEVLFDRHHRQLLAFCRHILGSASEAEDVVQETFLAAYRDVARSARPIVLRPWLYTVARHRCISILRAGREDAVEAVPERPTSNLSAEVGVREELRALLADVARLPEDQRAALVLSELGELSHEEIASVVGCPQLKVRALVFQARSNLAAARIARDTPCVEIRERIAVPGGRGTRALVRRHVAVCEGCREFRDEVRAQHRGFALLLPVAPSLGLKSAVIGALGVSGGGTVAVSGGALLGGGVAATSLVAVAIVGGAGHGLSGGDAGARVGSPAAVASAPRVVASGPQAAVPAPGAQRSPLANGRASRAAAPNRGGPVDRPGAGQHRADPPPRSGSGAAALPGRGGTAKSPPHAVDKPPKRDGTGDKPAKPAKGDKPGTTESARDSATPEQTKPPKVGDKPPKQESPRTGQKPEKAGLPRERATSPTSTTGSSGLMH